jgi:hypothetical protein
MEESADGRGMTDDVNDLDEMEITAVLRRPPA